MNFLFDVDGTLTEPVQPITNEVVGALLDLKEKGHGVYLVAGSTYEKVADQVGSGFMSVLSGAFTSSGAAYFEAGVPVYSLPTPNLDTYPTLKAVLNNGLAQWTGEHTPTQIEYRPGMLNFCPVGREASLEQRAKFAEFDAASGLRAKLKSEIEALQVPGLTAVVGGQVSIDLYFEGFQGKAYAVNYLTQFGLRDFIYFGDKMTASGNDYPAATYILQHGLGAAYSVRGPADTLQWLKVGIAQ